MMKKICLLVLALMMVFAMAISAQAAFTIDLNIAAVQTGASVTFTGNNLLGSGIVIDKITGLDTPLHSGNAGALTSTNGLWNFTAPQLTSSSLGHWLFQSNLGTSTLNISGNFVNGGTTITNPVPLTPNGAWLSAAVDQIALGGNNYVVSGVFNDTKSSDLLAYFGIPAGTENATFFFGITLPAGLASGAQFTSLSESSGDINQNTAPIPGSLLLLGSGIMGLVGIGIRRKSA